MSGNAPEYQYNEEYFARNKKARSSWVSKFLLGLAPAPLPTSFEEAVEKCIINDHTRYLPRDSNIVLDAFDPSNQDVVRNWHIRLPNNCMFHANLPWSLTHTHFPEGISLPYDSSLYDRCSAFEKRRHGQRSHVDEHGLHLVPTHRHGLRCYDHNLSHPQIQAVLDDNGP